MKGAAGLFELCSDLLALVSLIGFGGVGEGIHNDYSISPYLTNMSKGSAIINCLYLGSKILDTAA